MKLMQRSAIVTLLAVLLCSHGGSAFVPSRPSSTSLHSVMSYRADLDATTIATIKTLNEATINSSLKKRSRVFSRLALKSFSRDASSTTSTTLFQSSTNSDRSGPTRIIIAGAPASGKGTQCELIKERFGVVHLSTGDMLRAAVAAGTPVGVEAQSYMDSGRLVPDSTMIGVVW
jgi:adenylate kinase